MNLQDAVLDVLGALDSAFSDTAVLDLTTSSEALFRALPAASAPARDHEWRGLGLCDVCTVSVRVADSEENRAQFLVVAPGKKSAGRKPRVVRVGLTAVLGLRSRFITDVQLRSRDELVDVDALSIANDTLTLFDEPAASREALLGLQHAGDNRHWIAPMIGPRWRTAKILDQRSGDSWVEMRVPGAQQRLFDLPPYVVVRAIDYQRHGYRPQTLVTSLLDPREWPRHQISAIHSERWAWLSGWRKPVTRRVVNISCVEPGAVRARLWDALWLYNALNRQLHAWADKLAVEPARMDVSSAVSALGVDALAEALEQRSAARLSLSRAQALGVVRDSPVSPVKLRLDSIE